MTHENVFDMLTEAGVPVAYSHFDEEPGGTTSDYLTTNQATEIVTDEVGDPITVQEPEPYDGKPEPPFICFFYPGSDDLMADNTNYATITPLTVELYTNNKDFALEAKLEAVFRRYELPFVRTEAYINSERMYQITYNTEVLIHAEQS